jgi:hypothetical protein
LLPFFFLPGCVGEDREDCSPPYNVALAFSLPGDNGVDRFPGEIHSVDAFILDSVGNFLRRERVERAALETYQGLRLRLDPGRYRVTCWGNNAGNTAYEELSPGAATGAIAYASVIAGHAGDADSLYRAPRPATTRATRATRAPVLTGAEQVVDGLLTLEVPSLHADVTLPVEFSSAHHRLEVRVVGYDDGRSLPDVEIAGLPAGDELLTGLSLLDASLTPRRVASRKATVDDGSDNGGVATFVTFPFDVDDSAVMIRVLDPATGNPAYAVALADVIDPGSLTITIVIRITITFTGVGVTITVEGWQSSDVQTS